MNTFALLIALVVAGGAGAIALMLVSKVFAKQIFDFRRDTEYRVTNSKTHQVK